MNLNDFENKVDKKILQRGYDYYVDGNIIECSKEENTDRYHFDVEGSQDYEVVVELNDKEIAYSYCDCPYDFGPICKHEVAAYYYLKDNFKDINDKSDDKTYKKKTREERLNECLSNLPKEELINIIEELANENKTLRDTIILKYSVLDDKEQLDTCRKLIDSIIRKNSDRGGFVDYNQAWTFADEIYCIIEKIDHIASVEKNIKLAFEIGICFLDEMCYVIGNCDDSDGRIGGIIDDILNEFEDIISNSNNLDFDFRKDMFLKLMKEISKEELDDYKEEIFTVCEGFCDDEELRKLFISKIEKEIEKYKKQHYGEYTIERLLLSKFNIIKKYGSNKEVEEFIKGNITYSSFREMLINKYIEEENYTKALEAVRDAERNTKFNGIKWQESEYEIYKHFNKIDEQKSLGEELLLSGLDDYYDELKILNHDNFKDFYDRVIDSFRQSGKWRGSPVYLRIILKENDTKQLMDYVRQNKYYIESYAELLVKDYEDEVEKIYSDYIFERAENATDRRMYKSVCNTIKSYKKVFKSENACNIINKLLDRYKRKPAFVDELGKIK